MHTFTLSCIQTNYSRMQKDAESEQHKQTLFMTLSGEVRRALEVMLSRKQKHGKSDLDIFFCVSSKLFRNSRQSVKLKQVPQGDRMQPHPELLLTQVIFCTPTQTDAHRSVSTQQTHMYWQTRTFPDT